MKVLLLMQLTLIVQLVWAADFDFESVKVDKKFEKAQVIEEGDRMEIKLRPSEDVDSLVVQRNSSKEFKVALRRVR